MVEVKKMAYNVLDLVADRNLEVCVAYGERATVEGCNTPNCKYAKVKP